MLDIVNVEVVFLDHSYCKKTVFDVKSTTTKKQTMADKTLNWEEIGVEFHPPSPLADIPLSALSPPHSIDSGFDNEMNFLAELDGMDFESVLNMDSIFNTDMNDMNANIPKQKQPPESSKQPGPSAKVTSKSKVTDEVDDLDKSRKNAIAARENRLKKKKYVEEMEKELEQLKRENEALKSTDRRYDQVVEKLKNEVSYLKNVIANQSTLSVLVQRLVTTPGLSFASSFLSQDKDERPTTEEKSDADDVIIDDEPNDAESPSQTEQCKERVRNFIQTRYQTRGTKRSSPATESSSTGRKKARTNEVKGGICLHVGQGKVSLEFCSHCSIKANGNSQH